MIRKIAHIVLALSIGAAGTPVSAEEPLRQRVYEKVEGQVEKLFGSKEAIEAFKSSTHAEAYRLQGLLVARQDDKNDSLEKKKIGGSVILSGPLELKPKVTEELKALLLTPDSYRKKINECLPVPGVAIRFSHDGTQWDVLICLECDFLAVYQDDRWIAGAEFQPAHDEFLALIKGIYPNDKPIQELK